MKSKEELKAIKAEVETLSKKLAELTEEELEQVAGGFWFDCEGCSHYGHIKDCKHVKAMGACPHGHTLD